MMPRPFDESIAIRRLSNEFLPGGCNVEVGEDLLQKAFDDKRTRPLGDIQILLFVMVGDVNQSPYTRFVRSCNLEFELRSRQGEDIWGRDFDGGEDD
jgi:hypothetical protein